MHFNTKQDKQRHLVSKWSLWNKQNTSQCLFWKIKT